MPSVDIDRATTIYYEDDCFADPWADPEVVILVHGNAESSAVWYGWMSTLTARYRVIRPDLRGFGRSTIPPPGYDWSPAAHASDLRELLQLLGISRANIVGAKYGGAVAAQFAADYPKAVSTLALMAPLIKGVTGRSRIEVESLAQQVESDGIQAVLTRNQRLRLGSGASKAQLAWWDAMMIASDAETSESLLRVAGNTDISPLLSNITAPTLVVTTDKSPIYDLAWVVDWQRLLPCSDLVVCPGDGHHVAAIYPEECARTVDAFIVRHAS